MLHQPSRHLLARTRTLLQIAEWFPTYSLEGWHYIGNDSIDFWFLKDKNSWWRTWKSKNTNQTTLFVEKIWVNRLKVYKVLVSTLFSKYVRICLLVKILYLHILVPFCYLLIQFRSNNMHSLCQTALNILFSWENNLITM